MSINNWPIFDFQINLEKRVKSGFNRSTESGNMLLEQTIGGKNESRDSVMLL